jgi:hypothetical protein
MGPRADLSALSYEVAGLNVLLFALNVLNCERAQGHIGGGTILYMYSNTHVLR